jgi:hypothetical protein
MVDIGCKSTQKNGVSMRTTMLIQLIAFPVLGHSLVSCLLSSDFISPKMRRKDGGGDNSHHECV